VCLVSRYLFRKFYIAQVGLSTHMSAVECRLPINYINSIIANKHSSDLVPKTFKSALKRAGSYNFFLIS